MGLRDLVGQRVAVRLLGNALAYGRIANAYLFAGPAGVGKKSAALEFAKALNCEDASPGSGAFEDACGRCRHCKMIDARAHPDLLWVAREGQSVKIEQLQRAREEAWLNPSLSRFRIIVVPDAQAMTPEAANCLLKTLEEPPSSTVLVLTAPEPATVMATIVSRCQVVPFRPASADEIRAFLSEKGYDREVAARASVLSGGVVQAAREWAEAYARGEGVHGDEEWLLEEVLALASPAVTERALLARKLRALECAERVVKDSSGGSQISNLLESVCLRLRERLLVRADRDPREDLTVQAYARVMDALRSASKAIGHNANPKIGLTVAMLGLTGAGQDTSMSEDGDTWLLPSAYVSGP